MPQRRHPAPGALLAIGLGCFTVATLAGQGKNQSFAGRWKFSAEKTRAAAEGRMSDAPAFTRDDDLRNSGASGRTRSATSGGGTGGGGAGAGGRASLGPLGLYARPLPELVVEQTDSSLTVSDPRGTPRVYHPDGRKEIEPLLGADSLEIVAKWKDGKLTTERKLGSLGTVRTVYSLDARSHVLIVDVKLSGPQLVPPVEMHWFYDPAPGS